MVFLVSCRLSRNSLVHPGAVKAYRSLFRVKLNSQWKPVWRLNVWTAFGCFQRLPLEMPAVGIDLAGKWGTLPWGVEHSLCKIPFYLAGLESYPAPCNTGPSPKKMRKTLYTVSIKRKCQHLLLLNKAKSVYALCTVDDLFQSCYGSEGKLA